MKLYVAVDPGDAHVGYITLSVKRYRTHRTWVLCGGVLDVSAHTFEGVVDDLANFPEGVNLNVELIIESYQVRPVGHQRFNESLTLQIIGALRYAAHVQDVPVYLYPPGPEADLEKLFLQPIIDRWIPKPRDPQWRHAFSAMRALGVHLMATDPDRLMDLRNFQPIDDSWVEEEAPPPDEATDIRSPILVQWRTPL
jgi:hypothetical protein